MNVILMQREDNIIQRISNKEIIIMLNKTIILKTIWSLQPIMKLDTLSL